MLSKVALWNALLVSPALFGGMLANGKSTMAAPESSRSLMQTPSEKSALPSINVNWAIGTSDRVESRHMQLEGSIPSLTEALPRATILDGIAPESGTRNLTPSKSGEIEQRKSHKSEFSNTQNLQNQQLQLFAQQQDRVNPKTNETFNENILENDNLNNDVNEGMSQITNVSQLRDVRPGDWAYEALRELVERYGCIAGYPNSTYRGNRAMSRYEFAAGVSACLKQIEKLIAASTTDFTSKQDLEKLRRLSDEFGTEIAKLRGRVDGLEARTAELEATQFSTTTKLNGEVVVALTGFAAGQNANRERIPRVTALGDRVRLNFDTSFTGKDLLRTRLQATNLNALSATSTLAPEGDLRFGSGTFSNNNTNTVGIDALFYQFPIGKKTTVVVEVNAGQADDYTSTVNPYIDNDGSSGALSNFGTRNPIYNLLNGGGLGLRHQFSDQLELSLGYIATTPTISKSTPGNGLFNGPYGAIGQLTIKPIDKLTVGLTYIHSYNNDLTAGSQRANLRSFLASSSASVPATSSSPGSAQPAVGLAALGGIDLPVSSNSYGLEASFQVNPQFVINSWVGYTASRTLRSLPGISRGDLSILNFAVNLAFPDFGKKGSLAGVIFGMEPKVTGVSRSLRDTIGKDRDTSFHIEGFYQYQVTDNIAITPGLIWLTAPNHDNRNADDVIGVVRTTFTF